MTSPAAGDQVRATGLADLELPQELRDVGHLVLDGPHADGGAVGAGDRAREDEAGRPRGEEKGVGPHRAFRRLRRLVPPAGPGIVGLRLFLECRPRSVGLHAKVAVARAALDLFTPGEPRPTLGRAIRGEIGAVGGGERVPGDVGIGLEPGQQVAQYSLPIREVHESETDGPVVVVEGRWTRLEVPKGAFDGVVRDLLREAAPEVVDGGARREVAHGPDQARRQDDAEEEDLEQGPAEAVDGSRLFAQPTSPGATPRSPILPRIPDRRYRRSRSVPPREGRPRSVHARIAGWRTP